MTLSEMIDNILENSNLSVTNLHKFLVANKDFMRSLDNMPNVSIRLQNALLGELAELLQQAELIQNLLKTDDLSPQTNKATVIVRRLIVDSKLKNTKEFCRKYGEFLQFIQKIYGEVSLDERVKLLNELSSLLANFE